MPSSRNATAVLLSRWFYEVPTNGTHSTLGALQRVLLKHTAKVMVMVMVMVMVSRLRMIIQF
jgi:hypothetical protein